jgi:hypothetical protein
LVQEADHLEKISADGFAASVRRISFPPHFAESVQKIGNLQTRTADKMIQV